jgi:lipopolysaccharide transport system ATP-binding protein
MGSIVVSAVGKAYKQYPGRWSRLAEWLLPAWLGTHGKPRHTLTWVLQDVTFSVQPGEAVGIVGINGAGKSTLLKMITGTTQPTTGHVQLFGKVAALLELGMGFHPDFTGRQNAVMACQLLGFSKTEIQNLMPEIEAFAEIGDYIDQPVRVYSSGMQVRLAFSVAVARRPDILIVDEALSVGDAYFQHKSFERIRQLGRQGTTLLIVSHDKGSIQGLCNRALLLNEGRLVMQGAPNEVMDYYNALLAERGNPTVRWLLNPQGKMQTISGTGEASIVDIAILSEHGERLEVVNVGQTIVLMIAIQVNQVLPELVLGYEIKDHLGQSVYGTNTHHLDDKLEQLQPGSCTTYRFTFRANLGVGSYSVSVALHTADTHVSQNYEWRDLAVVFNVINVDKEKFVGVNWLPPRMEWFDEQSEQTASRVIAQTLEAAELSEGPIESPTVAQPDKFVPVVVEACQVLPKPSAESGVEVTELAGEPPALSLNACDTVAVSDVSHGFYRAFEDRHRGSRQLIKERQRVYFPFVEPLADMYSGVQTIDLGCGRGEWLELMVELGFDARGVDLDDEMLAECRVLGLSVQRQDGLAVLKKLPDASQAIVSGFQFAEHISFDVLQSVVQEALRVLKPAGLLILETPNPENILVGTTNFYLDPTHQRPLAPLLIEFLPEYYGFHRVKTLRLQEPIDLADSRRLTIHDVLGGVSPDYAIVAQKADDPLVLQRVSQAFDLQIGVTLAMVVSRYEEQMDDRAQAVNAHLQKLDERFFALEEKVESRRLVLRLKRQVKKAICFVDEIVQGFVDKHPLLQRTLFAVIKTVGLSKVFNRLLDRIALISNNAKRSMSLAQAAAMAREEALAVQPTVVQETFKELEAMIAKTEKH